MKKIFLLFTLLVFLSSCLSTGETPIIIVDSLLVNGEIPECYLSNNVGTPILKEGDELELTLQLDGNGANLQTFSIGIPQKYLDLELIYDAELVTTEEELIDVESGLLRFSDGVEKAQIKLLAQVEEVLDDRETLTLSFYLSSNAGAVGASQFVYLRLEK